MTPVPGRVAAAVLRRPDGRILLLKRSAAHTSNPGKWCFVTGYVEDQETPEKTAVREVDEELGITTSPVQAGAVVHVHTPTRELTVFPFLFDVPGDLAIRLDREHTDFRWILPAEIYSYDIVQQLDEDLMALSLL